jgi:hypothetical protein
VRLTGEPAKRNEDDKTHSGRLLLRMPRALHGELAAAAEERGISLNQLIVGLLSHSIEGTSSGAEDAKTQQRLAVALTINLVVLVAAGAIAIALLVVAWRGGF